jgi:hypothetical protein
LAAKRRKSAAEQPVMRLHGWFRTIPAAKFDRRLSLTDLSVKSVCRPPAAKIVHYVTDLDF